MSDKRLASRVKAVRRFNRFYTRQIGILDEHVFRSPLSLGEARVLYELAHADAPLASDIADFLGLDAGYLSRMVTRFVRQGLVSRSRSRADGRQAPLSLTRKGAKLFGSLDRNSDKQVESLLEPMPTRIQAQLVGSMRFIQRTLAQDPPAEPPAITLRRHRAGDIGWVIQRHGEIYGDEYGWGNRFEALVAEIAAKFLASHDPERERCWIAECASVNVGCVFLVRKTNAIAQLRLLLVDPSVRGQGLGQRLVKECVDFARAAGYRKMRLWTNDILLSARRIYEGAGFRLIEEEEHENWGVKLTSQTWEQRL